MDKYQRYDQRYNERTRSAVVNGNRRWTAAEEARLLRAWCKPSATPAVRIHVARTLGRSYVACAKRHTHIHRRRGCTPCRGNRRGRGS